MKALTFAIVCLSVVSAISTLLFDGRVESRSIFDAIPGMNLVKSLTYTTLDTLNNALDGATGPIYDQTAECLNCPKDPDDKRNVSEIIRSRGFEAQEYEVVTKDGYILTIQRIINPLVDQNYRSKLKPVIMQHGLMSSSVDWVINSLSVKPKPVPRTRNSDANADSDENAVDDSPDEPNSLGFYMANEGYDVFLANSRGNLYGQKHVQLSPWDLKFWSFTFDEQIKYDLPAIIAYIQNLTNHTKVGYVGHSQGTLMAFGLLSDKPEYADIMEPVVALAPVAYVSNSISPAKYFAVYTPVFEHINYWFATSNVAVKYLVPIVCGPHVVRKELCANLLFLSVGFDEDELDDSRISAYMAHMPSGTSVKNIAHYGQMVLSGRFAHFDHGIIGNQMAYGRTKAPDYDLSKIRSKSLALFTAENDWLASPKDVARLKAALTVKPYAVFNITESFPKFNHIDFVYGKDAGRLVNTKIIQVFKHFDQPEEE